MRKRVCWKEYLGGICELDGLIKALASSGNLPEMQLLEPHLRLNQKLRGEASNLLLQALQMILLLAEV